ncbi:MAG: methyltransferase domain-containing protein [Alphaproteobacteria bacterium]|jgi:phosphoethanolamine N-methyltransferase|nr:methyltransferase domain-containing protein [Alphaproteobacteria bacterium]
MSDASGEYAEAHLIGMETIWGQGFMSPGGDAEVAALVSGIEVRGKKILDLGCGLGGPAIALVANHGAGRVVAVDVQRELVERSRELAQARGVADRIGFRLVDPGPLPFEDASFDAVFSMGVIVKIPEKRELFAEVRRVLRPRGVLVGNDWLRGRSGPLSEAMAEHATRSGLAHHWATPEEIRAALAAVEFEDVAITDRSVWIAEQLRKDLRALESGPIRDRLEASLDDGVDGWRDSWGHLLRLAESGEFVVARFRATRPS